jgi:hypothetical protein
MRWTSVTSNDDETGASLVEFALVLPLLLMLLLGMIDFGVRLANVHSIEDGIRDAARQAAVGQLHGDTGCVITGSPPPNTATRELICMAKSRIGLSESDVRIRISFGPGGAIEGEPVLLCAQFPADSVSGVLPNFGLTALSGRSVMRLEVDPTYAAYAETSIAGGWPGCSL